MTRKSVKEQRLEALEDEFGPLLQDCLDRCSRGRWGLFGQNDNSEAAKYLRWAEAERLKEIALEIQALRKEFGQPNGLVERFLSYFSMRDANTPGEPKLAKAFLLEIQIDKVDRP